MPIESDLVNLIADRGFSVAVAVWLLWERTTITRQVLTSAERNISVMEKHITIMEKITIILDRLEERLNK